MCDSVKNMFLFVFEYEKIKTVGSNGKATCLNEK